MTSPPGRPRVRTRLVRATLASFSAHHPDRAGDLIGEIPPGVMLAIQGREEWIDLEDDRYVPEAIVEVLGREPALDFFSLLAREQLDSSLFRPFLHLARTRFEMGPYTLLRMVPVGWKVAFRDYCLIFVRPTADAGATVSFRGLPHEAVTSPGYQASFLGLLLGLVRAGGMEPSYDTRLDTSAGLYEVDLEWRQPG